MSKKVVVEQSTEESTVEKPVVDESSWKQELEQLDRLLTGRLNEAEAREYANSELAKHDGVVHLIEKQKSAILAQIDQVIDLLVLFLHDGRQMVFSNHNSTRFCVGRVGECPASRRRKKPRLCR